MKEVKKEVLTIEELFLKDYEKALEDYRLSKEAFNNAEADYIDIAFDFLKSAELKVNALCKKAKLLNITIK